MMLIVYAIFRLLITDLCLLVNGFERTQIVLASTVRPFQGSIRLYALFSIHCIALLASEARCRHHKPTVVL